MPNRILKESICFSPEIEQLSWFEEVVFYRLLTIVDDFGHTDGRNVVLTHSLFPTREDIDKQQVGDALDKLVEVKLISRYTVDNRPYIAINTWHEHQKLRRYKQVYPFPDGYELPVPADKVIFLDGKTPQANGKTPQANGKTPQANGKTPQANGKTPQANGKTPQANGKTPQANGKTPQANGILPSSDGQMTAEIEVEGEIEYDLDYRHDYEDDRKEGHASSPSLPDDNPFADDDGAKPSFDTIQVYAGNSLRSVSPGNLKAINDYVSEMGEPLVRYAIDAACANGAPTWRYAEKILIRLKEQGITTVADAKASDEKFRHSRDRPDDDDNDEGGSSRWVW